MGKATYKGLVPPDDPMFSGGPQMFSRVESKPSPVTSVSVTAGATPVQSSLVETQADGKEVGALRIARYKHQKEQFSKKK